MPPEIERGRVTRKPAVINERRLTLSLVPSGIKLVFESP
jgi:hypothetical protein